MKHLAKLRNTIRHYAWGSKEELSHFLNKAPSGEPEAELWMGAHRSAPSHVQLDGGISKPLDALIAEDPQGVLGEAVVRSFGPRLPFLFKLLAAGQPLSLQAHPDKAQAEAGFARENAKSIPVDAGNRNYRDDNHKPEIICALTPFWALRGFRPLEQIETFLEKVDSPVIAEPVSCLRESPGKESLRQLFGAIMNLPKEQQQQLVHDVLMYAETQAHASDEASWLLRLNQEYPGDIGVVGAALLNLVKLEPGQAMYLPAGELHAYLSGVGMELMANSDNVLRGGLTPKHVDVDELLKTLGFEARPVQILTPEHHREGEAIYRTPSREFALSTIRVEDGQVFHSGPRSGVEVLFCRTGELVFDNDGRQLAVSKGESLVAPAAAGEYRAWGNGVAFRASVPV